MMYTAARVTATTGPAAFADTGGRSPAGRSIGSGRTILTCMRSRGTMDLWDPAFPDALADTGLGVIVFDYSGLGLPTGMPGNNPPEIAQPVRDLIAALGLEDVVLSEWSLGGRAAQAALALSPDNMSLLALIGTNPAPWRASCATPDSGKRP